MGTEGDGTLGRHALQRIPVRDGVIQRREKRFRSLFPCEQLRVVNPASASIKINRIEYQPFDNLRNVIGICGIEIFASLPANFRH